MAQRTRRVFSGSESFSVRMRWQAEADCTWELETQHPGFPSAEEAALFANGLADVGVADLRLERGELRMVLADGSSMAIDPDAVTVWTLAKEAAGKRAATDADFSRVEVPLATLSRHGLDGAFVPLAYSVIGPDAEPIDVRILLDEDLGTMDVTVALDDDTVPSDQRLLLFGLIPRA